MFKQIYISKILVLILNCINNVCNRNFFYDFKLQLGINKKGNL
jgi:hypothetical protein